MGKHTENVKRTLDQFWLEHHRAPTIREMMQRAGVPSSSHCRLILLQLAEAGEAKIDNGRAIPRWVVDAINLAGRR